MTNHCFKANSRRTSRAILLALLASLAACQQSSKGTGNQTGNQGVTDLVDDRSAARFLNQATFGANRSSIDELVDLGTREAWIERQMDLQQTPASDISTYVKANGSRSTGTVRDYPWMYNALNAPDQLRQRVAFALSEIFVISDLDYSLQTGGQYGVAGYYDMLSEHAFDNFRDLLERVTLHPAMGIYLGMVGNQKADAANNIRPDENYAREVLQLFSIGLNQLNTDGSVITDNNGEPCATYDNNIITNFARVFTGWNFADTNPVDWIPSNYTASDIESPMIHFADFHDANAKTLLNNTSAKSNTGCRPITNGTYLPASGSSTAASIDMDAALNNIFNHPNVGPFIAKALIQRFTTSNPSASYIARVAEVFNNNGQSIRGDLAAVIKAILLDNEAMAGVEANAQFGKLREPLMLQTQLWRAVKIVEGGYADNPDVEDDDSYRYKTYTTRSTTLEETWGQAYLRSPSVFNFFLPNTPLPKVTEELLSPESQLYTEGSIALVNEDFYEQIYYQTNLNADVKPYILSMDVSELLDLANEPSLLVEHLNLVLLGGQMHPELIATLTDLVSSHGDTSAGRGQAVTECLFIITTSPAYRVQL